MIGRPAYELLVALALLAAVTAGYAHLAREGAPTPGSLVGHLLGVVGFVLMLATETLYSIRKRVAGFHYGPMYAWLQAHVVTGLVGAYLVVLHAAWRFNGLAGFLTLVTLLVVLSGVVGRYLYTAVPRSLDGAVLTINDLEDRIEDQERRLSALGYSDGTRPLSLVAPLPSSGWLLVLAGPYYHWRQKRHLKAALKGMDAEARAGAREVRVLLLERQRLLMQVRSLESARRLLSLWHLFHIPLSAVLFVLAAVHIIGALYYSTFSK